MDYSLFFFPKHRDIFYNNSQLFYYRKIRKFTKATTNLGVKLRGVILSPAYGVYNGNFQSRRPIMFYNNLINGNHDMHRQ